MFSGHLRAAFIVLIVTAINFSTAQAQAESTGRTHTGGILTDRLSAKQLAIWRRIERYIFDVDAEGRLLHPVLHSLWQRLETSGHTIYLEISENLLTSAAGLFRLEKFDPSGRHHTAVIKLRPRAIDQAYVRPGQQQLEGFIPFEGLVKEERYAEVLGHELAHAADVLLTPGLARQVEETVEQINELLLSPGWRRENLSSARKGIEQRIENRDCLLQRLEINAVIMEARIWRELRASQQVRKGK